MSTAPNQIDLSAPPIIKTIGQRSLIVGAIFAVVVIIGAFFQPDQFYRAYVVNFMDWLGVALGSMALLMLRHLTKGGWGMIIRRTLGAAMRTLPLMTILFIPILFGLHRLYPWTADTATLKAKGLLSLSQSYLNPTGFVIRAIIYFLIWNGISYFLSKWSAEQDHPPVRKSDHFKKLSAPGLILYAFTISFAAIDWVMSMDPKWISTIYGLIFLAGQGLSAICFAVVAERILSRYRPMRDLLKQDFVHDHGKLMLTFVMLWAYFSFSQWLIIWAGNLPDEISFYTRRLFGGWQYVGLFLVIFHFALPFLFLLSRPFKREIDRLAWLAAWLLVAHYVDLFWYVQADFSKTFTVSWFDIVLPFAMGGIWLAYFFRNLYTRPLVPAYDLFASEVLEPAHE
jgi:hypothetical protein